MRRTAFLLGSRRTPKPVASNSHRLAEDEDGEDEDYDVTYDLLRPDQVSSIVRSYEPFGELTASQGGRRG